MMININRFWGFTLVTFILVVLFTSNAICQVSQPIPPISPPLPPSPPLLPGPLMNLPGIGKGIEAELMPEEKNKVISIINDDVNVRKILEKGIWHILHIGPRFKGSEKIGALVDIRFERFLWIEGEFYDYSVSTSSYTAKLWVASLLINVDLKTNQVVGLSPGMGRPQEKISLGDEKLLVAERVALNHPAVVDNLGESIESYLAAVYYTADYPRGIAGYPNGIAFFNLRSNLKEMMIGVDLNKMMVVDKFVNKVRVIRRKGR